MASWSEGLSPAVVENVRQSAMRNISEVIGSDTLGAMGDGAIFCRRLEAEASRLLGVRHALTMCSGTAALQSSLAAVGVGPGDEVIVDPLLKYGAVATLHLGAVPRFADIDERSLLMSAESVKPLVSSKTRALVATATFGVPNDISALRSAAPGVPIVEDCAQAILARGSNCLAGTEADLGCFSFQSTKHLSTGEGGLVVTNDAQFAERVASYRSHGVRAGGRRADAGLGHMFRMTELSAAVGVARLEVLPQVVEQHCERWRSLTAAVEELSWLRPQEAIVGTTSSCWTWCAILSDQSWVDEVARALVSSGSALTVGYCDGLPIHLRPLIQRSPVIPSRLRPLLGSCPVAESVVDRMLHLRVFQVDKARLQSECQELRRLASI